MIIQINLENGKPVVAQVINSAVAQTHTRKPPNAKYPWDEWTDGKWREITFKELGDRSSASFVDTVRRAARRRGLRASVHTDIRAGKFRFRFLDPFGNPLPGAMEASEVEMAESRQGVDPQKGPVQHATVPIAPPAAQASRTEPPRPRSCHGILNFAA